MRREMTEKEKQKLKKIIDMQASTTIRDNTETFIICPKCEERCNHASKYSNDIPKNYRTYYCEVCSNLIYSDTCIRELKT